MHPNVDETPFATGQLRRTWLVFDAVYNPEQTLLVKEARLKGCRVVTGVDMFIRQVALQFKVFTDKEPPVEVMRLALNGQLGRRSSERVAWRGMGQPMMDGGSDLWMPYWTCPSRSAWLCCS